MMLKTMVLIGHLHDHLVMEVLLAEVKLRKKLHTQVRPTEGTLTIEIVSNSEVEETETGEEDGAIEDEVIGDEAIVDEVEEGSKTIEVTVVGIHYHLRVSRVAITHNQARISHNRLCLCRTLKQDSNNPVALQSTSTLRLQMNTHLSSLYCGPNFHKPPINKGISKLSKACSKACNKAVGPMRPQLEVYQQELSSILHSFPAINLGLHRNGINRDNRDSRDSSNRNSRRTRIIRQGMEALEINNLYIYV